MRVARTGVGLEGFHWMLVRTEQDPTTLHRQAAEDASRSGVRDDVGCILP